MVHVEPKGRQAYGKVLLIDATGMGVVMRKNLGKKRYALSAPLLPAGVRFNSDDALQAFERVWTELIVRIRGDAWKSTDKVIQELRAAKYPHLLSR